LKLTHAISIAISIRLSERHPEKQGLKRVVDVPPRLMAQLSERHPEKQGLKLVFPRLS